MINENFEIVGLDERVLRSVAEEIVGMPHDELIERRRRSHHYGAGTAAAASRAPGALPGGGNRSGVAGHHYGIQRADVNSQFQGAGGDNSADAPIAETALDFPALVGKI